MHSGFFHKHIDLLAFIIIGFFVACIGVLSFMIYSNYHPKKEQPSATSENQSVQGTSTESIAPVTSQGTVPTPSSPTTQSSIPKTTYSNKPYTAGSCTQIPIPYKTNYINVSYLDVGETSSVGGIDGVKNVCTPDSTGLKPIAFDKLPMDKTVYVGTGPPALPPPPPPVRTYQQAESYCRGAGVPTNSSAWQVCIQAYLNQ